MSQVFKATNEWQALKPDQMIPAGLHVRMNLATGQREAKLVESDHQAHQSTVRDDNQAQQSTALMLASQARPDQHNTSAGAEVTDKDDRYRTPLDWQGLLKFSLEYMDNTKPAEAQEMSEEKKRWLKEAVASMSKDEIALMREALQIISKDYDKCFDGTLTDEALEEKESALDNLNDLVDLIDNAQDLIPLGGYSALVNLLGASYPSLVWRALEVLATTLQNNPICQSYCLDQHLLVKFMDLMGDKHDSLVRVKALYALSGLVRGHEKAADAFVLGSGLSLLQSCIAAHGENEKLATKAEFMLNQLMVGGAVSTDVVAQLDNMVATLVQVACTPNSGDALREQALHTLSTLANGGGVARKALLNPSIDMKNRLGEVKAQLQAVQEQDPEAHEEELLHITQLASL